MKQTYTLVLNTRELEIIVAALAKQPYEVVESVITALMSQIQKTESIPKEVEEKQN